MQLEAYIALDWPYLLAALAGFTRTARGKAAALSRPLLSDPAAIADELDTVDELILLREVTGQHVPVAGVQEIALLVVAAGRGESLDGEQLREVAESVVALARLSDYFGGAGRHAPVLARRAEALAVDPVLHSTLAVAFDERGELSGKVYPKLEKLRVSIAALDRRVRGVLEGVLGAEAWADVLQDRYITLSNDRFVLPVKADAGHRGLGIVHDASRRGQTVYVEPHEAVPLNNDRRIAEAELIEEQRRILAELSRLVGVHAANLETALDAAAEIDVACARKTLSERLDATRPKVASDGIIDLRGARHPLLALQGTNVVANDVGVNVAGPVLVLTGPNAGGKTVALKTIGLCALLVRIGCFVPAAPGSRVDVFAHLAVDIGDQQTVHEGLSSFSGHLKTLHAMLESAGPQSLLLLDELCSGTDPAQGGPLARALLEHFADLGARVVTTTHYAQVKAMAAADDRVKMAAMEYSDGRPTFRVVAGVAGESHALSAARHAGLPPALIERARALMDEGERALSDAVQALEEERTRSHGLALRAEQAARAAEERERSLRIREDLLKRNVRELEKEAAAAFTTRLRDAEREIAHIITSLRESPDQQSARRAREQVVAMRALPETVAEELGKAVEPKAASHAPRVGDRVRVKRLGTTGEVTAVDGKALEVAAGSMTVRVGLDDVELAERDPTVGSAGRARRGPAGAKARTRQARSAEGGRGLMRMESNTLDLRGERVEAGLRRLEAFLDGAVLNGHDGIFVLHGHGTNAMKDAVRKQLRVSPYVASSGPAAEDQGGDAFTAVVLRG